MTEKIISSIKTGNNIIQTPIEFRVNLSASILNTNITENIKNIFRTKYLNKAYKTCYIMDLDLSILDNELPCCDEYLNILITLPATIFNVVVNDIISCTLVIDNELLQAYNDKVLCNIIPNAEYNINLSDKNIKYKQQIFNDKTSVYIIIKNVKNLSDTADRILTDGEIYIFEDNEKKI
jgi:hypothetical protein